MVSIMIQNERIAKIKLTSLDPGLGRSVASILSKLIGPDHGSISKAVGGVGVGLGDVLFGVDHVGPEGEQQEEEQELELVAVHDSGNGF